MQGRRTTPTGRMCAAQNEGGGVYIQLDSGMVSPVFADEGDAIAWFDWVRRLAKARPSKVASLINAGFRMEAA